MAVRENHLHLAARAISPRFALVVSSSKAAGENRSVAAALDTRAGGKYGVIIIKMRASVFWQLKRRA